MAWSDCKADKAAGQEIRPASDRGQSNLRTFGPDLRTAHPRPVGPLQRVAYL